MSLVAAVVLAGVCGAGCGSEEPTPETSVRAAPAPAVVPSGPVVPCEAIIGGAQYSGTELDDRTVFGVVYFRSGYRPEAATPSGKKDWPYFADAGLIIRGDAAPVEISVPKEWRDRAGISWGDGKIVHSLSFPSCPPYGLPWNAYDGGIYLRTRRACVPLTFKVDGESATLRFGIGTRCRTA